MKTTSANSALMRFLLWLKGFPKRHKIITALVVLLLIRLVIVTPIKNPFASDAITVRGRFPFDQGYELIFIQDAEGTAKWFRRRCGGTRVEEAVCTAGKTVLHPIKVDGQHYELTIYRDRYFAGLAGWAAGEGLLVNQFKAGIAEKYKYSMTGASHGNMACDGSDESLKKFHMHLFCSNQKSHKDYKKLELTEGQPVQKNEWLLNFWLDSELDAKLAKDNKETNHEL